MPYPTAVNVLRPLKVMAKWRTYLINLLGDLTGKVFSKVYYVLHLWPELVRWVINSSLSIFQDD